MNDKNRATFPTSYMEPNTIYGVMGKEETDKEDTRVSIHIHSIRKRLTDADGISAKAAIDGLVSAGILPDDSPKYVKEVSYSQEKGSPEKTIIEIN